MKVALTTISDVNNFGTHLQIFSLTKVLHGYGFEVELVNYVRDHRDPKRILMKMIKEHGLNVRSIYSLLQDVFVKRRLDKFSGKYLSYSKKYNSLDELKADPPRADIYLTGSDQVWNSHHNKGLDRVFYFDYVPQDVKVVSYAASFGMEKFPEDQIEVIISLLNKYSKISVREDSAKKMLAEIGIVKAEHVLDPTFLLDKYEWEKIASNKGPTGKYLLIYTVEPGYDDLLKIAREIAKQKKLKICLFTPGYSRQMKNDADEVFFFCKPEDFVSLFLKADYIVVSSFHGTAFSINLNKQFVLISPRQFNTRTNSILKMVNLSCRSFDVNKFDIVSSLKEIDYSTVNEIIDKERRISLKFLQESL